MNRSDSHVPSETEKADPPVTGEAPFVAKLVRTATDGDPDPPSNESSGDPIRVGSPFHEDPADLPPAGSPSFIPMASGEAAYGEFGPFIYTAMGASAAAVLVLLFAAIGAWWFPTGGALVAVLGTVLSVVGLFSTKRYRYAAMATLPMHMGLFFLSYARSLG